MNLKEFGNYIKNIRESKELSLRQVDYLSNITFSNLSMIENGSRRATPFVLKELARVYCIDYIDLLEKSGYIDLAEKERIDTNLTNTNKMSLPLLGIVKAGYDYLASENIVGFVSIDNKIQDIENCYALKVTGNSMEPILYEDDIIIVHKQNDVENGQTAIILIDDEEATVKKVIKYDNYIELFAFNSYYPPRKLTKKDNFQIIGKVVEARISKIFE